jgi:phospholipid/cholesterol/gamma-HCH transport system permease protein
MTAALKGQGWQASTTAAGTTILLDGDWTIGDTPAEQAAAVAQIAAAAKTISFDAAGLGTWDSALLVFLSLLRQAAVAHGVAFDQAGLPAPVRGLLALLADTPPPPPARPPKAGMLETVGRATIAAGAEAVAVVELVGVIILRTGAALRGRARVRGVDLLACIQDAGLAALPIVTIVNLLVGAILAFVGAVQLRRFGADVYIANLVGVAVVREMAALMTAIVLSGRTGGAYAAEIATMQGSEEIDALRAIGIPVHDYLVLPRVWAMTAMTPLLYLYGSAVGILGGFLVATFMLDISAQSFSTQLTAALTFGQLVFGFVKSISFGLLIAIAGCRIGLTAGRSATDVGKAATTAVVVGIVGVIAVDAVYAICANAVGF